MISKKITLELFDFKHVLTPLAIFMITLPASYAFNFWHASEKLFSTLSKKIAEAFTLSSTS